MNRVSPQEAHQPPVFLSTLSQTCLNIFPEIAKYFYPRKSYFPIRMSNTNLTFCGMNYKCWEFERENEFCEKFCFCWKGATLTDHLNPNSGDSIPGKRQILHIIWWFFLQILSNHDNVIFLIWHGFEVKLLLKLWWRYCLESSHGLFIKILESGNCPCHMKTIRILFPHDWESRLRHSHIPILLWHILLSWTVSWSKD